MRVLVACEFSGRVRDAFIAAGHQALSVDLLPTETPGPHYQGDVRDMLELADWHYEQWDLLIAHPPCTYLANSGVRWLYGGKGRLRDLDRWDLMSKSALFFRELLEGHDIPRVAVENPIMHRYGREIIGRGPDQIIQPWQFGHGETKATGLWLRGLPPLTPTDIVDGRQPRVHHASPGPDRWKERSRTLPGIAVAMADQWGRYVTLELEKGRMKREVVLIQCDDCGTQATEMHELTVTVDGHELTGDVCCQGCAVRFAQRHLIAVIENPAAAELALRRVG